MDDSLEGQRGVSTDMQDGEYSVPEPRLPDCMNH